MEKASKRALKKLSKKQMKEANKLIKGLLQMIHETEEKEGRPFWDAYLNPGSMELLKHDYDINEEYAEEEE